MTHEVALRVPFRRLDRKAGARGEAWAAAARDVLTTGAWQADRRPLEGVEEAIAGWCGVERCVATASGSAALWLAMLAFGVGPGDEVVTVGNTYAATVSSIRLAGATPVLVDVDRDAYTMAAACLREAITPRTRLVVPVHLFGRVADMEQIVAVAREHGVPVLEEACQSFGASRGGRRVGSFGDAAVFSFGRSKAIGGTGEGGAVVTADTALGDRLWLLANQGRRGDDHVVVASNLRMDPVAAAILKTEIDTAAGVLVRRREVARRYDEVFVGRGLVRMPAVAAGHEHGLYVYVVEAADRTSFRADLAAAGVGTAVHYARAIHAQTAHAGLPGAADLRATREAAARIVSLPCDEHLDDAELEYVTAMVVRVLEAR